MRYPDREELKAAILTVLRSAPTNPPSKRGYTVAKVANILRVRSERVSPIMRELQEEGAVDLVRTLEDGFEGTSYYLPSDQEGAPSSWKAEQAHKRYQTKQERQRESHEENRRQMYEKMRRDDD